MKEKITGMLTFLIGIGTIVFGIMFCISENYIEEILVGLLFILIGFLLDFYVVRTNFGFKRNPSIEKIEIENEILKKQIEQKELKKKLEE